MLKNAWARYPIIVINKINIILFLNIFLKFGKTIRLNNVRYVISAGTPIVAAICKYSLCALSVFLLLFSSSCSTSSLQYVLSASYKLSGPHPKIGFLEITTKVHLQIIPLPDAILSKLFVSNAVCTSLANFSWCCSRCCFNRFWFIICRFFYVFYKTKSIK